MPVSPTATAKGEVADAFVALSPRFRNRTEDNLITSLYHYSQMLYQLS